MNACDTLCQQIFACEVMASYWRCYQIAARRDCSLSSSTQPICFLLSLICRRINYNYEQVWPTSVSCSYQFVEGQKALSRCYIYLYKIQVKIFYFSPQNNYFCRLVQEEKAVKGNFVHLVNKTNLNSRVVKKDWYSYRNC